MKTKQQTNGSKARVGVLGMGIMGGAMAETLLAHDFAVTGFDIDPKARARLKKAGGKAMTNVADVACQSDVLIISLPSSKALAKVTEALVSMPRFSWTKPPIVIEASTLPLADKEAFAKSLRKLGITTLDSPVSGTAVRIRERDWTFFVSGPQKAFRTVLPVLNAFTDNVAYVGPFGNGMKMKFVANHLVAVYNVAYAESITFARKMGLDPEEVLQLFGNSPVLGTGLMRLRMPMMVARNYLPATMKVDVWQKDMAVIAQMATQVNCPIPLFATCAPIFNSAMAMGKALEDTASAAEVLSAMAGIPAAPLKPRAVECIKQI
jgi:3-hydroxyisobutyrate dehydrogenase-like beta-hydroxyacid dehydrogenase